MHQTSHSSLFWDLCGTTLTVSYSWNLVFGWCCTVLQRATTLASIFHKFRGAQFMALKGIESQLYNRAC